MVLYTIYSITSEYMPKPLRRNLTLEVVSGRKEFELEVHTVQHFSMFSSSKGIRCNTFQGFRARRAYSTTLFKAHDDVLSTKGPLFIKSGSPAGLRCVIFRGGGGLPL